LLEKALPSALAVQLFARKRADNCINRPFCAIVAAKKGEQLHKLFSGLIFAKVESRFLRMKKEDACRHPPSIILLIING